MEKIITNNGGKKTTIDFHPERESHVAPFISKTKNLEGVRYYITTEGRMFIADVYDRMFKPPRGRVKARHYKGINPAKKIA